jgi:hypothetical protein
MGRGDVGEDIAISLNEMVPDDECLSFCMTHTPVTPVMPVTPSLASLFLRAYYRTVYIVNASLCTKGWPA